MADVTLQDDTLYDTDFHAWTQQQAAILRDMAQRRLATPLDLAHLAEEVEDLGRTEYHAAASHTVRMIEHLLKLEYAPSRPPRRGWRLSVIRARNALRRISTASIEAKLVAALADLYEDAREEAAAGLQAHDADAAAAGLPGTCPYAFEDICTRGWFPPNRHGLADA